jgi:hypothetical protein
MYKKLVALLILNLGIIFFAAAQEQTTTQTTEEVKSDTSSSSTESRWRNLITNDVDEKSLIKLDVIPFFNYGAGVGYERRLGNANSPFSFYTYGEAYADNITTSKYASLKNYLNSFRVLANTGVRYYYNKNSRIRKGKNANSFSSNYFGLNVYGDYATSGNREYGSKSYAGASGVNYGIQRRLGKIGFIDWNVEAGYILRTNEYPSQFLPSGGEVRMDNFYLRSKLRVGIAF